MTARIDEFTKLEQRPILLLDRIDYLLTNFSFDSCIKSLYKITNIIARNNGILLVRLNPSVVDSSQLALIREELKQIPSQKIHDIQIEDYLYNILTFIYEENQNNLVITYKKISKKFSISKVTTAKRLDILKEKGLILIKKHGKTKTIKISEKGKTLLNGSKII
jgi:predicted transcriptional regulator